jgi:hypothetical protein
MRSAAIDDGTTIYPHIERLRDFVGRVLEESPGFIEVRDLDEYLIHPDVRFFIEGSHETPPARVATGLHALVDESLGSGKQNGRAKSIRFEPHALKLEPQLLVVVRWRGGSS